ncbi:MAG: hypothetical protein JO273_14450 [Methylobacteriaceae bacterium]|nr:hypothetical protein [Methylobacteriaceae bacterium]
MRAFAVLFALGGALAVIAASSPAAALNARSWVASTGSDGNSCTRSSPCATFAGALAETSAGGEINCVDQGDFSNATGLSIGKSITIDCEGAQGHFGFPFVDAEAIFVNASASDVVTLRGLDIDGNNAAGIGINFNGGAALHIEKCSIRNFAATGANVLVAGIADFAPNSELFVSDTVVTNNGTGTPGAGILIIPFVPNSTAKVTLNRVEAKGNFFGIKADGTQVSGGVIQMTVRDTVSAGNASNGIVGTGNASGPAIVMMIDHSASSHNAAGFGVIADGPKTTIRLGGSSIAGNINGVGVSNGGLLQSYGTNQINGNSNDGIASLTPIGLH